MKSTIVGLASLFAVLATVQAAPIERRDETLLTMATSPGPLERRAETVAVPSTPVPNAPAPEVKTEDKKPEEQKPEEKKPEEAPKAEAPKPGEPAKPDDASRSSFDFGTCHKDIKKMKYTDHKAFSYCESIISAVEAKKDIDSGDVPTCVDVTHSVKNFSPACLTIIAGGIKAQQDVKGPIMKDKTGPKSAITKEAEVKTGAKE